MKILNQSTFDSVHFVSHVQGRNKCKKIRGHTHHLKEYEYEELEIKLEWVMEFAAMKNVIDPFVKSIDHKLLNTISVLENPTCEIIAVWLWNKIKPEVPILTKIELHKTPTSGAVYEVK